MLNHHLEQQFCLLLGQTNMKHLAALEATIVIHHTVAREAQGRLGRKRRRGDYLALEARLEAKRYMTAAETKLDSTEMQ